MAHTTSAARVTLITPAYNQGEYLAATIDSVLAQDHANLEYLVLDDGSTDTTQEVLKSYGSRVRWESHQNMGQSATLNKGWASATGAYLGYLSADDCLHPKALSVLAHALDEHPEVMVVYCDFDLIDAAGKPVGHVKSRDFDLDDLRGELICQPGVGALFRREVFERCGGWNPAIRKIPDFEFWLRAAKLGPFMRVPHTLGLYRVHEDSTAIRPLAVDRSLEIVRTMQAYWGSHALTPLAQYSLSRAHLKAAQNHAQSGRMWMALGEFARAAELRPKTWMSLSSWRTLLGGMAMRWVSRIGWLSARLR